MQDRMRRDLVCHSQERLRGSMLVLLWVNGLEPSLPFSYFIAAAWMASVPF